MMSAMIYCFTVHERFHTCIFHNYSCDYVFQFGKSFRAALKGSIRSVMVTGKLWSADFWYAGRGV